VTGTELVRQPITHYFGEQGCFFRWARLQDGPPVYERGLWQTPSWSTTLADGTVITVHREGDEVNGMASRPDGSRSVAYDMGDRVDGRFVSTPMVSYDKQERQVTPDELAVMNDLLRPAALERTWDELFAAMEPCPHHGTTTFGASTLYRCDWDRHLKVGLDG
jgi:hypothetical protein